MNHSVNTWINFCVDAINNTLPKQTYLFLKIQKLIPLKKIYLITSRKFT